MSELLTRPTSLEIPKGRELIESLLTVPGNLGETYQRFHRYSPRNIGFLALQGCPMEPVATFKRWQDLGRQVQRGEKAYSILRPIQVKVRGEQDGVQVGDQVEEVKMIRRFKVVKALFAYSQTAGEDLPPYDPPSWSRDRAEQVLDIERVPFERYDGNVQGYSYDNFLAVSPIAAYPFKTWAHEAGHIVSGHTTEDKLLEYQEHRGPFEFEAEATAHLVLKTIGASDQMDESESRAYIKHHMGEEQPTEKNFSTILNSTGRIVEAGYEKEASDE